MSPPDLSTMTGDAIVALLRRIAADRGTGIAAFVRPVVVGKDTNGYLRQLELSDRPTAATIARLAALLAGEPVPPAATARPRRTTAAPVRRGYADRVTIANVSIVDRTPCWQCGIRADLGCTHRGPSQPVVAAIRRPTDPPTIYGSMDDGCAAVPLCRFRLRAQPRDRGSR